MWPDIEVSAVYGSGDCSGFNSVVVGGIWPEEHQKVLREEVQKRLIIEDVRWKK